MSQVRMFAKYGVSSLVVRYDLPVGGVNAGANYPAAGNNALTSALASRGIFLVSLDGVYHGAGSEYLQLHDTSLITAGNVPMFSFWLGTAAGPIVLPSLFAEVCPFYFRNGLTIAVSSTAGTYTASAGTVDLQGSYEDPELIFQPGVYQTAGDLSSVTNTLTVWATGTYNRLQRLIVQEQLGTARFIFITPSSSISKTQPSLIIPIAANAIVQLSFGQSGIVPFKLGTDNVLYNGCYVNIVDNVIPPYVQTSGSGIIYAVYRGFSDNPYW